MKEVVLRRLFQISNLLILALCLAHIGVTTFLFRGKHAHSYASILLYADQAEMEGESSGEKIFLKSRKDFTNKDENSTDLKVDTSSYDSQLLQCNGGASSNCTEGYTRTAVLSDTKNDNSSQLELKSRSQVKMFERKNDEYLDDTSFNAGVISAILSCFLLLSCFGGYVGELHRNKDILKFNAGLLVIALSLSLSFGVYMLYSPLGKEKKVLSEPEFEDVLKSKYIPEKLRRSPQTSYANFLYSKLWDDFRIQTKCWIDPDLLAATSYEDPLERGEDEGAAESGCFALLNRWFRTESLALASCAFVAAVLIMISIVICVAFLRKLKPHSS